jgi:tetratricopeptide (TPR) repeat protein
MRMTNGSSADESSGMTIEMEAPPEDAALADEPAAAPVTGAPIDPALEDADVAALAERLRAGRCVLCAGARLVGGGDDDRSFRGLVERLLRLLPGDEGAEARRVLDSRPLAAAGFARRRLGDRFLGELRRAAAPTAELPDTVRILGELPFRAVVTTAYDDAFERAFTRDGQLPRIYTPRDAEALQKDGKARFVFKALGDPARADSVVWSAEDLQAALADGGYRTVAHDLYRSRSFLFVGFDGRDPDLAILLERVLAGARPGDVEHFAILPGLGAVEKEELRAAYRIRVLAEADVAQLARTLQASVAAHPGAALPDDDDFEGWLALLAEEPGRKDAVERLGALEAKLRDLGDWEKVVDLLLGRVAVEQTAATRATTLLEVSRIFEHEIKDLAHAFTVRIAAYKEQPRTEAWDDLERLAAATGMWVELLAELDDIVMTLSNEERAHACIRLARLYGDKLGKVPEALAVAEQALELLPSLTEATELKLTLLKRLERWSDLAAALGAAGRLVEQAETLEVHVGDSAAAAAVYRQALAADPSQQDVRAALELVLRRRGDWREVVTLLDERAGHAGPDDARAHMLEAAALMEQLGERAQSIAHYEALAAAEPRDLTVLRALERLYQADGQDEKYVQVLGRQAEVAEARERGALYRRMAALYEDLPDGGARAQECLEKLIVVDPRSEDAYRSLERLYRADKKWSELIDVLRRHVAVVAQPAAAELHAQIGAIYEDELNDPAKAIDAFLDVETTQPNHGDTMAALTRLYEKTGAWQKAVDVLERRAQLTDVKPQKLELSFRVGEIYAAHLGDAKAAEAHFVRALEIDATHVPSMTALVEIYRKNGEFLKAAKLLVEAVPHTNNRLERTRLYVEAGEVYLGLDDSAKATELYLAALGVDPEHVEAGERVAELLWQAERWADLVPVLEMLTRKPVAPPVQLERLVRLGRAAKAVGLDDKVGKAYARAAEVDPTDLTAQRGLADWHYARGQWAEASAALERLREHHAEALPPSEKTELYYRLGNSALQRGDKDGAKGFLEQALAVDPAHRPSLLATVELGTAAPAALIDAKKALIQTAGGEEKIKLLGEIGDLYLGKLNDHAQALASWREALLLRQDDHKLLHKCLDVYVEDKAWPQALEMLEQLIAIETRPNVRAKYRHAAGLISRDELGRPADAATHLALALEDDAAHLRSAQALEELYKELEDWKELARFYRKTLKRLGPESAGDADGQNGERLRVWSAIAELCLNQLGDKHSAVAALEAALVFDRDNLERHKQLADVYVQAGPDQFEKSILEHQYVLRREKNRVLSYRALKHLYIQTHQREKSLAVSYALTLLKKGEPDDHERIARQQAESTGFALARRPLGDEQWTRLTHPDQDRYLDALFALLAPTLALNHAQPHKALGLQRKDALAADDPRSCAKVLKYVSTMLGVNAPEAYVRPEQKEAAVLAACVDKAQLVPVLILGAPLVGEKRHEREQVFELARRVAQLRPERLLRLVLPSAAPLAQVIAATLALAGDSVDESSDDGKIAAAMKKALPSAQLEQVAAIGKKLRADEMRPDAAALAWLQASDLTAARAGYVLAGDLESCARLVASEPPAATALPAMQRLLDLVWSSVTEDLFTVRKHLGLL